MTVQTQILCQSAAYVFLGGLILVILTRLAIPRPAKIGTILVTSLLYIAQFQWTQNILGWSAPVALPQRFEVLSARVVEPDPQHKTSGAVHLWIEEIDGANVPSGQPRAYLLPYSAKLAYRAKTAEAEIKKGHRQGGRAELFNPPGDHALTEDADKTNGATHVAAGGDPSGGGFLDPAFLGGQSKNVELVPLPAPDLPAKGDP